MISCPFRPHHRDRIRTSMLILRPLSAHVFVYRIHRSPFMLKPLSGSESIHPRTASGTPTTSPSRCFSTGPALSPAKARRRGGLSVNSFDGVSRDQNRRFGPGGVIKAAMSDRAPSVSSSDLRLSDSQIFPLYSSSIEPWKMPRARSRARRLALNLDADEYLPSAYFPLIKSVTLR